MAQFMQPLPGVGDQTPAGRIGELRISGKSSTELAHPFSHTLGEGNGRWRCELLVEKFVKTLLATLQILETAVSFQPKRTLHREHPRQHKRQLVAGQSPLSCCVESDGVCQWVRASRSRERRCQWRC